MNTNIDLSELENRIGYCFKNRDLLVTALTHSSFANELKINKRSDYERIEFLGDAVLELISSEFFYNTYKDMKEGELTRLRSSLVCEQALAYSAREFELQNFVFLGKGEENTGGRERDSIISDVFEALLGAVYLDGGIDEARKYVDKYVLSDHENKHLFYDAKTILQEEVQKDAKVLKYVVVEEKGPDHDRHFKVNAEIDGVVEGTGVGKSKKQAEQQAAYSVLKKYR